ncbi:MAG: hypothetical protein ACLSAP_02015 [Oscillospiraceae bacterium]
MQSLPAPPTYPPLRQNRPSAQPSGYCWRFLRSATRSSAVLHFANYRKRTTFDENTGRYLCTIYYDKRDEIELLIRVLSFGPVVRVLGPAPFLKLVKQRVARQYELLSKPLS